MSLSAIRSATLRIFSVDSVSCRMCSRLLLNCSWVSNGTKSYMHKGNEPNDYNPLIWQWVLMQKYSESYLCFQCIFTGHKFIRSPTEVFLDFVLHVLGNLYEWSETMSRVSSDGTNIENNWQILWKCGNIEQSGHVTWWGDGQSSSESGVELFSDLQWISCPLET